MNSIELDPDAEQNGLALILSELLKNNIETDTSKANIFEQMLGSVAIVAEDAQVALTLVFQKGRLRIYDGIYSIPDIAVRASSEDITNLSLIESLPYFGLPDLRKPTAQGVLKRLFKGQIRLHGILNHFKLFTQFGDIMAVSH
ncbi:MAG: hypothetical protein IPJ88_18685 [Myxococcales bacterium]|nr:MAG: hypothetical protein IPJ88_18685 [Myxococcales bacterium]